MKNIIFIAPPAAGKGTYSEILEQKYNYEHVSTGDLLRNEKSKGTELGIKVAKLMESGALVPDDIVLDLLNNRIEELGESKKIILDGVPRNMNQVKPVLDILDKLGEYVVIYLDVSFEEAMKRTIGRLTCPKCKKGYNKLIDDYKPNVENNCDYCGSKLVSRSDDNEETFKVRFDNYLNETSPLIEYFKGVNNLEVINANLKVEDNISQIERVIL